MTGVIVGTNDYYNKLCGLQPLKRTYTKLKKAKKSINKQTNKQINILEPKYLSQIKSDLHEILRVSDGDPSATKWGPEGPPVGGRRPPALRRS